MIIEFLVLIFLLWIFMGGWKRPQGGRVEQSPQNHIIPSTPQTSPDPSDPKEPSDADVLSYLKSKLNTLCSNLHLQPKYRLHVSHDKSYTMGKEDIYIVLRDSNGTLFDINTLILVSIHELTHVICPSNDNYNHSDLFKKMEDSILETAHHLKICNKNKSVSESYPCMR